MTYFRHRRLRSCVLALLAVVAIAYWLSWIDNGLGRSSFASGYMLYGLVGFLALFNLRKKLPMLPLGSAAAWLQLHIYTGVVTGGVFAMHALIGSDGSLRLPNGTFESLLSMAFMMTFVSGVVGLIISRRTPKLLRGAGEQVVYERIPQIRRALDHDARSTVLASVSATGATTLADFYTAQLYEFFARPRSFGYFLRPTGIRRRRLLHEMRDLGRYLTSQEQTACERLFSLVRKKDDLDFHDARQRLLKVWLFGHIGLTYVLVAFATWHGVMALAFRGDAG